MKVQLFDFALIHAIFDGIKLSTASKMPVMNLIDPLVISQTSI